MTRAYNFNAGPSTLPEDVLKEIQAELLDYQGSGISIIESSHRAKEYAAVQAEAQANILKLAGVGDDYYVLFMGGGATAQFAMIPMNLAADGQSMAYVNTGAWSKKAIKEAQLRGPVKIVADTTAERPACIPDPASITVPDDCAYLHITSNETIGGTQWASYPVTSVPLVADMSSDIFCRPIDGNQFGLIYAGAQKNLGPAGAAVVIIRKDLADRVGDKVPYIFRYKLHMENDSMLNTPPCFSVYAINLVTRWIEKNGGITAMGERNALKAKKIYDVIDGTDFYSGTAAVNSRSIMNITFRLPSEELEAKFVKDAKAQKMIGLKGHRSVGGIRASIYNAFPAAGIDALIEFMKEFERTNG